MPIPIPIPMPMGPPPGKHFHPPPMPPVHEHHQSYDEGGGGGGGGVEGKGDVEVRKIYLLQPMPKIQPQPHLKGGGFMGGAPVQNHIHVQAGGPMHGHKFGRTAGARSISSYGQQQQQQQQHQSPQQQSFDDTSEHQHSNKGKTAGAEVKILPIVMIPPVAPVPPIQMSNSGQYTPKMTLTPHFNNYIVSTDRKGRTKEISSTSSHDNPANDYGGSLGASVFRDHYSQRSRVLRARNGGYRGSSMAASEYRGAPRGSRMNRNNVDYPDYNDYDYYESNGQFMRHRRHRPIGKRQYRPPSINSIRDVMEAHGSHQMSDETGADQMDLYPADDYTSSGGDQDVSGFNLQRRLRAQPNEMSLDDFGNQAEREQTRLNSGRYHSQSAGLNGLRAETSFNVSPIFDDDQRDQLQSSSKSTKVNSGDPTYSNWHTITTGDDYRDPRNVLDDDEWRYAASAKLVSHVAPSPTTNSTLQNATTTTKTLNVEAQHKNHGQHATVNNATVAIDPGPDGHHA